MEEAIVFQGSVKEKALKLKRRRAAAEDTAAVEEVVDVDAVADVATAEAAQRRMSDDRCATVWDEDGQAEIESLAASGSLEILLTARPNRVASGPSETEAIESSEDRVGHPAPERFVASLT